ncbi:hypothetical protein ACFX11_023140 [Malus domestica]
MKQGLCCRKKELQEGIAARGYQNDDCAPERPVVMIKKNDLMVRLHGQESGRKGKLVIAVEIFAITPSFFG